MLRKLLIIQTILFSKNMCTDFKMINHYLDHKNLNQATFVGCLKNHEKISLIKEVFTNYRQISIFDLNTIEDNVAWLNISKSHIGIILDSNCKGADKFLNQCGRKNFYDFIHHWMILSNNKTKIIAVLEKTLMHINAGINIFLHNKSNPIQIIDAYNPSKNRGGRLIYNTIGFYNKTMGRIFIYEKYKTGCKYVLRKNMTGVEFSKVMVVPPEDLQDYDNVKVKKYIYNKDLIDQNRYNRFQASMMIIVSEYYNYSFNVTPTDKWGIEDQNGTFSGVIGMFQRKKVDFAMAGILIKPRRILHVSYGKRGLSVGSGFVFLNPKVPPSFRIFFKSLRTIIWILCLLTMIVYAALIKLLMQKEQKMTRQNKDKRWSSWALFVFGAYCQQGSDVETKMYATRILFIFLFMNAVIVYQFYSAALMSTILMAPPTLIKTVYNLLHSNLKSGYQEYSYVLDFFLNTQDAVSQQLGNKTFFTNTPKKYNYVSLQEGINRVGQGGYAYHSELRYAYPLIESLFTPDQVCKLRKIKLIQGDWSYVTYAKWSPFKDMADTVYQRMTEVGIYSSEKQKWSSRKPECLKNALAHSEPVGVIEIYPAFVFLLIGIVISLLLAIIEKKHYEYIRRHTK